MNFRLSSHGKYEGHITHITFRKSRRDFKRLKNQECQDFPSSATIILMRVGHTEPRN